MTTEGTVIGRIVTTLRQLTSEHGKAAKIVFSSHAASTLAAFAVQIALIRMLPIEAFGALAAALALHAVVEGTIVSRGNETALSLLARHHESPPATQNILILQLMRVDLFWVLGCLFAYVVVLWVVGDSVHFHSELLVLLALGTCAQFSWGTVKAALFVLHPPDIMSKVELQYTLWSVVASLAGLWLGGAVGYCMAYSVSQGMKAALGLRALRLPLTSALRNTSDVTGVVRVRDLAVLGFTGTVRSALAQFVQQMDLIVLAFLAPGAPIAHYRAAKTLAGLPARAATPLWVLARRTLVSDAQVTGSKRFLSSFGMVSLLLGGAGALFLLPAILLAEPVFTAIFGRQYAGAAPGYAWLAPAAWVLLVMTGWSGFYGSVSRRKTSVIALYVSQAALFVAAAFLFVPHSAEQMAIIYAVLQLGLAGAFWFLLVRDSMRPASSPPEPDAP
jgi:O-antigen/teichoic acid export membrane protein